MNEGMAVIVAYICIFGWIPILAICSGISQIILTFKGDKNEENEEE